ncbi:MAG: methionyl-tRNA formyltransferase [Clostridia bacterium]|nr:methionyl-tRNA formyltransferase [Clostridia bacterium]
MRILFMGTPDFSVPCLKQLIEDGHQIVGAVTQPDKPKGRGHKLMPPPVKELAMENQIPVFQPESLKNEGFLPELRELNPELIVVVAYGKILPSYILDYPKYGCINVHASLLPQYRGAGPIQWSVINGEAVTGVTTMYMAEALDAGDMILKAETPIGEEETAGELFDRLSEMGAKLLSETVDGILSGNVPREKQDDALATYAPMVNRDTGHIDWTQNAETIRNLIRGTNPWPLSYSLYQGTVMKVLHATKGPDQKGESGEILGADKQGILVACGEGETLLVDEIQMQGSKRMQVRDYLNGHEIAVGTILE